MSRYRDRRGQVIGPWVVVQDVRRTKSGRVLWQLRNVATGQWRYLTTERVIRLDRDLAR